MGSNWNLAFHDPLDLICKVFTNLVIAIIKLRSLPMQTLNRILPHCGLDHSLAEVLASFIIGPRKTRQNDPGGTPLRWRSFVTRTHSTTAHDVFTTTVAVLKAVWYRIYLLSIDSSFNFEVGVFSTERNEFTSMDAWAGYTKMVFFDNKFAQLWAYLER